MDRRGKRVGKARVDDEGAVDGGALPGIVSVPKESAPLVQNTELVGVGLPSFYGALRYVRRPVGPRCPVLPHPVPAICPHAKKKKTFHIFRIISH